MSKLRFVQGPMPERIAGLNNIVQSVRVVYETDPAVVRAMLPKPLVPAERPEVFLQFANVEMHIAAGNVIKVGALTCAIMCEYEGKKGGYVYVMAMEGESVVTGGRERTLAQYEDLLVRSGFKLKETKRLNALSSILIGEAA